jgi:hypothetical protein
MLKVVGALAAACTALGAVPAAAAPLTVGPGPVAATVACDGQIVALSIRPNRGSAWNTISLAIGRGRTVLHGARVTLSFAMPAMAMGTQTFVLREGAPGTYRYLGPALVMPGRWVLTLRAVPRHGPVFTALIADRVL